MQKKLISHEMPLALMKSKHHDLINDYMYVLLHKLEEDSRYADTAMNYDGHLYLDNSCFELGESLDNDLLYKWYKKLNPSIVIAPDVLGDKDKTIERTTAFIEAYPDAIISTMAVAQGDSQESLIECYNAFKGMGFAMIGIPFVYSWVPKEPLLQASERISLLKRMVEEGHIDTSIKHHLLGTWAAREFLEYQGYNWVYSVDTSNPIMAAIDGYKYTDKGLWFKPHSTFDSTYELKSRDIDMNMLYNNVDSFKEIVNGR
jgi:hypothetical protein